MSKYKISQDCKPYGDTVDGFIDKADYNGLEKYLDTVKQFADSHISPEYTPVFYYLGTAMSVVSSYKKRNNNIQEFNDYHKACLYYYRMAIDLSDDSELSLEFLSSLYNNYANELQASGRIIEALNIYRKGISINPNFGMLFGNYGSTLSIYANMVNDLRERYDLHCYAYQALCTAVSINDPNMHEKAKSAFEETINNYEDVEDAKN